MSSAPIRTIGSGSASALRAGLIFAGTRPSLITSAQAREALADHTSGLSSPIIVGMNSDMCTARCITSPSVIPTDEVIVDQSHFTSSP